VTQYFDSEPTVTSSERIVDLVLPDVQTTLITDRGVFSADHVDIGSKLLLLDGPPAIATDRVLVDVGCGYGPIAYALAARNPDATVYAIDVNERARDLCARNTAALGNVIVAAPEDVPADLVINRVWSNPPIRVGKNVLHDLLNHWLGELSPDGSAHLVVQKHLGADSLHSWLERSGWQVERRSSKKAFRLLDITRADPATSTDESS